MKDVLYHMCHKSSGKKHAGVVTFIEKRQPVVYLTDF